jgi:hypothetical protein
LIICAGPLNQYQRRYQIVRLLKPTLLKWRYGYLGLDRSVNSCVADLG